MKFAHKLTLALLVVLAVVLSLCMLWSYSMIVWEYGSRLAVNCLPGNSC